MQDYQGNSNKTKETKDKPPKKDLGKVVTGDVIVKPKTVGSRFRNIFFGGDIDSAFSYVVAEVLLPALRNLVVETVSRGTDRLIYGDSAHRRRPTHFGSRIQYNNPVSRGGSSLYRERVQLGVEQRPTERWSTASRDADTIIVASKTDAENVVEQLTEIVDKYELVSVADLNELLGLPSSHVDNKWGWTNISSVEIRQVREGWKITFPPLEEIQ